MLVYHDLVIVPPSGLLHMRNVNSARFIFSNVLRRQLNLNKLTLGVLKPTRKIFSIFHLVDLSMESQSAMSQRNTSPEVESEHRPDQSTLRELVRNVTGAGQR